MARPGILYSEVAQVAAKLTEEGKNPTVDTVREGLGSIGSKSTIAPFLKRWKLENQDTIAETAHPVPATLLLAIKGVYVQLQAEVNQKLEQAEQVHQQEKQAATEQAQRRDADNQALTDAQSALSVAMKLVESELSRLQSEYHALNVTTAAVQSENLGLQHRLSDRAAEVLALNQQLNQARAQFEHYQEAAALRRAEDRQAAEQRSTRLEQELVSLQQRAAGQQSALAQQDARLAHLASEKEVLSNILQAVQDDLTQIRPERDRLTYQVEQSNIERQERKIETDALQQALIKANMALAVQQRETQLTSERLQRSENKLDELAQEKIVLLREQASLQAQLRQWLLYLPPAPQG